MPHRGLFFILVVVAALLGSLVVVSRVVDRIGGWSISDRVSRDVGRYDEYGQHHRSLYHSMYRSWTACWYRDVAIRSRAVCCDSDTGYYANHTKLRIFDPSGNAFRYWKSSGLIAVVIYAIPPMIRLTNLGIRLVDKEVLEAADAFGASPWQKLVRVQIPLALPNIFAGVNQTIMMSLAMVVIASMIGVTGLGQPVLKAISKSISCDGSFEWSRYCGLGDYF